MRLIVWLLAVVAFNYSALGQGIVNPSVFPNDNIVQNGGVLIDQANEGTSVTLVTNTAFRIVDRWFALLAASTSGAGNPTSIRQDVSSGLIGFNKSVLLTASATPSTTTPAALTFRLSHPIEGADVFDLNWGAAGAKTLTMSLWLKSSIANANYAVAIANSAVNRSYPHICNVPSAATWTQCTFVVPGDTSGTWLKTPGSIGMYLFVSLSAGSTFQGTANIWQAGFILTTSAQTQFTDTASATLEVTGIKMERGSVATPFVADATSLLLTKVRRMYQKSFPLGTIPAQNTGVAGSTCVQNPIALGQPSTYIQFNPPMYGNPTVVTYNPSAANANWRDVTAGADVTVAVDGPTAKSSTGVTIQTAATITTLADVLCIHWTAQISGQ